MTGTSLIDRLRQRGVLGIVASVCKAHCVPLGIALSRDRHKSIKTARHAVWVALYAKGLSTPEIGALTGFDHTTVLNAVHKARVRVELTEET